MTKEIREVYDALLPKLIDEPMAEYHAKSNQYLSSGKLKNFRDESPAYFKADLEGKIKPFDSVAFAQGRAAHTLILEGRNVYDNTYRIGGPVNPKTGKHYGRNTQKFADWCIEQNIDRDWETKGLILPSKSALK